MGVVVGGGWSLMVCRVTVVVVVVVYGRLGGVIGFGARWAAVKPRAVIGDACGVKWGGTRASSGVGIVVIIILLPLLLLFLLLFIPLIIIIILCCRGIMCRGMMCRSPRSGSIFF